MQIFIKTFSLSRGWISKTLDTEQSDTIESLKDWIWIDNFTSDASKVFRFNGATLLGCKTLAESSVVHGSTLYYVRWPALVFSAEKEQVVLIDEHCVKDPEQPAQLCIDPPVESRSAKVRDKDDKFRDESREKPIDLLVAVAEEIQTAVGSLWDRLIAFKKQADKDEKKLAKRLSQGKRVKCPKAACKFTISSQKWRLGHFCRNTRSTSLLYCPSMESITRICAAVAASVHLPCAVVSSAEVSSILSANYEIHGHFFANGSKIREFRSEFLDEKKLIAFLNKCLGLK